MLRGLSLIEMEERKALRAFRPIIYVCSPYAGDIKHNVEAASRYCRFAVEQGYIPIAPHLLFPQFLDDTDPTERELGLFFGNALMSKCAEVWVFGSQHLERHGSGNTKSPLEGLPAALFHRGFEGGLTLMHAIEENQRTLYDGTRITTYSRAIESANVLEAEAGTTGYMGGDTGHGGRTYFRVTDLGGTDIRVNPIQDRYGNGGFEVTLGGDCELSTMITALKFITQVLEEESKEVYD
jgi:hypothetical protein